MSTTVTHLQGATRALPRRAPVLVDIQEANNHHAQGEKAGMLATIARKAAGVGRWLQAANYSGVATATRGDDLSMAWLIFGAAPIAPFTSRQTSRRCCQDYPVNY